MLPGISITEIMRTCGFFLLQYLFACGHPFIALDEQYLIWDSKRAGVFGGSDLYISFRRDDSSWGPTINMCNAINSEIDDTYNSSVSFDRKYFFFNRIVLGESFEESEANIFWVDARIIEHIRNQQRTIIENN